VTDANGCTATASALVDNFTGITVLPGLNVFELLPNPTDGLFDVILEFDRPQEAVIDLYAYNGQLLHRSIHQGQRLQVPFDLTGQHSGVFLLLVRTAEGYSAKPIVLTR
jgi:hypothetical protein